MIGQIFIPIIIDEDEETEESSLWKVSKPDWPKLRKNIIQDARERGYKNAHFNGLVLRYERDYPFNLEIWGSVWFLISFFLSLYVLFKIEWPTVQQGVYYPIIGGAVISAMLTFTFCSLNKTFTIDWIKIGESSQNYLIEVFGSKMERAKYRDEIGLKEAVSTKQIVKIRCKYCHTTYDETLDKCPHCGGQN